MKDKLTKKRLKKVDYVLIIEVAGLSDKFLEYQWSKRSNISLRRQALAFCRSNKVDIDNIWQSCQEHGVRSLQDWTNLQVGICKYNLWEND